MNKLTIHGHRQSMQMRLRDDGCWTIVDPIIFRLDTGSFRKRLVVRPPAKIRNPKPKRVRARLLRDYLLEEKGKTLAITRRRADSVYCEALRIDGVSLINRVLTQIGLVLKGLLTRGPWYIL